jgi:hypothetical protein
VAPPTADGAHDQDRVYAGVAGFILRVVVVPLRE